MDKVSASPSIEKKAYKSWRKSSEADGISKSVNVEEIENGFIVSISEYGRDKNDKYYDRNRKFYSKENPLDGDDMVMDSGLDSAITNFVKGI